eukprot:jgi/Galph1/2338/GphlegSOOS_G993.1
MSCWDFVSEKLRNNTQVLSWLYSNEPTTYLTSLQSVSVSFAHKISLDVFGDTVQQTERIFMLRGFCIDDGLIYGHLLGGFIPRQVPLQEADMPKCRPAVFSPTTVELLAVSREGRDLVVVEYNRYIAPKFSVYYYSIYDCQNYSFCGENLLHASELFVEHCCPHNVSDGVVCACNRQEFDYTALFKKFGQSFGAIISQEPTTIVPFDDLNTRSNLYTDLLGFGRLNNVWEKKKFGRKKTGLLCSASETEDVVYCRFKCITIPRTDAESILAKVFHAFQERLLSSSGKAGTQDFRDVHNVSRGTLSNPPVESKTLFGNPTQDSVAFPQSKLAGLWMGRCENQTQPEVMDRYFGSKFENAFHMEEQNTKREKLPSVVSFTRHRTSTEDSFPGDSIHNLRHFEKNDIHLEKILKNSSTSSSKSEENNALQGGPLSIQREDWSKKKRCTDSDCSKSSHRNDSKTLTRQEKNRINVRNFYRRRKTYMIQLEQSNEQLKQECMEMKQQLSFLMEEVKKLKDK